MHRMGVDINKPQILTAVVAIFLGVMVYLLRSPGSTYFLPESSPALWSVPSIPNYLTILTDRLPDFIHPFAFALLTSGLLSSRGRGIQLTICICWFVLESVFEFGQYFKDGYLRFIPSWFDGIPLLCNAKSFFLNGTFDLWDLFSIVAGTIAAFSVMFMTSKRRKEG